MCNCGKRRAVLTRQVPTVTVEPVQPRSVPTRAIRSAPPRATITVDPAIWGPPLWRLLHTLAEYTTTTEQTAAWSPLLAALKTDIPCPDCRNHFTTWLRQHPYSLAPPRLRQRYIIVNRRRVLAPPPPAPEPQAYTRNWVLDLHNSVNRRTRKAPWSANQVRDANTSLELARAALQTLATLIGPGAHAQLTAMLVPLLPVPEESASLTNPLRVAEEVQPEVTENPLLVVEETVPEDQVQVQPEEESPRVAEDQVQPENKPLLVVEETVPEDQVQPEEESPRVAEEEVQVPPTTIVEI